jgi:putative multicomponent Na+:H+ antiporter subunit B
MIEIYVYIIVALLPLSAIMLVIQSNPYRVLIIRGILGAVAALVYALLGAADVALTEALMGTLLAITLYIVAVRSSMVVRLGALESDANNTREDSPFGKLLLDLRRIFGKKYLRLEVVPYDNKDSLQQGLMERELHAICVKSEIRENEKEIPPYQTTIRVLRLHELLQEEAPSGTLLKYLNTLATKSEQH